MAILMMNNFHYSLKFPLIAANAVRRQLRDLSGKIGVTLQPIFVHKKMEQDLKPKEIKPSIVSQHCVLYKFTCDLCDANYVVYIARHLHQRIAEHKYSAIGKHLLDEHGDKLKSLSEQPR